MLAGICGLSLGCFLSQWLKKSYPNIDPIICGAGLLTSAPLLLLCTYAAPKNSYICFVLLFFGQVALNLNWAIVGDILLVRKLKKSTFYVRYLLCLISVGLERAERWKLLAFKSLVFSSFFVV